jgi:hypothetical protein
MRCDQMKNAKGSLDIKDAFETLLFIGEVLAMITILFLVYSFTGQISDYSYNKMRAVENAHAVENCLENNGEYIRADFLDYAQGIGVTDLSELCGIKDTGASVENLENNRVWLFSGGRIKDPEHSIWIPIFYDQDDVQVGKLNVAK